MGCEGRFWEGPLLDFQEANNMRVRKEPKAEQARKMAYRSVSIRVSPPGGERSWGDIEGSVEGDYGSIDIYGWPDDKGLEIARTRFSMAKAVEAVTAGEKLEPTWVVRARFSYAKPGERGLTYETGWLYPFKRPTSLGIGRLAIKWQKKIVESL